MFTSFPLVPLPCQKEDLPLFFTFPTSLSSPPIVYNLSNPLPLPHASVPLVFAGLAAIVPFFRKNKFSPSSPDPWFSHSNRPPEFCSSSTFSPRVFLVRNPLPQERNCTPLFPPFRCSFLLSFYHLENCAFSQTTLPETPLVCLTSTHKLASLSPVTGLPHLPSLSMENLTWGT